MKNYSTWLVLLLIAIISLAIPTYSNEAFDVSSSKTALDIRLSLLTHPDTKTVDFSTYELVYDDGGKVFLAALISAAERGVKVRGLIDRRIAYSNPMLIPYLLEKGIELKFFSPITIRFWDLLRRPLQLFRRFNARLHDKIFLVNSEVLIIGDKNYGSKYFDRFYFLSKNNEYLTGKEVMVKGEGVNEYVEYFEGLWQQRQEVVPALSVPKFMGLRITDRWRNRLDSLFAPIKNWINLRVSQLPEELPKLTYDSAEMIKASDGKSTLQKIFEKILSAKPGSQVLIENSYFVLFPELRHLLKTAREKNIEITLNLNYKPEKWIIVQSQYKDLKEIVDMGVKVFLNQEITTHAKLVLIKGPNGEKEVIVTSANFDPRSYKINNESGMIFKSAGMYDNYYQKFQDGKSQMLEVSLANQCSRFYTGKKVVLPSSSILGRGSVKIMRPHL